jgi:hypothetical protein
MAHAKRRGVVVYRGDLAKPIPWTAPPLLLRKGPEWDEWVKKQIDFQFSERLRKFPLLLEHYGMPRQFSAVALWWLSISLAIDHVPGFQTSNKVPQKGRPHTAPSTLGLSAEVILALVEIAKGKVSADDRKALMEGVSTANQFEAVNRLMKNWPTGYVKSDREACVIIAKAFDERLRSRRKAGELKKRAKRLENIASAARAQRKAPGKAV